MGTESELDGALAWTELNYKIFKCPADVGPIAQNPWALVLLGLVKKSSVRLWPQRLGFPHSKTEVSRLVVDETLSAWGQSFIFAPTNLTTIPHPPMRGSSKYFSRDSMEDPYLHPNKGACVFFPMDMAASGFRQLFPSRARRLWGTFPALSVRDHPSLLGSSGIPTKRPSHELASWVAFSPSEMMNLSGAGAASSASFPTPTAS